MLQADTPRACKPDLITYSIMIKGYCKDRKIEQAFKTQQMMEQAGIRSDFALYKSLIIGCVKNNQMEMALKVYQNMRLLGIRAQNVYRVEKKSGRADTSGYGNDGEDVHDLSEFYEICKQASGRHTKWRKNNFLL
mmetsp:Transcript_43880/g.58173  ORF Transcript_43880/g.58173 Transcript_43880/m.58173 type:complete len:135 (+) Transcript_43880:2595-2999(+)